MIRAGIVGASGYTGFETVRLLHGHPEVEILFATSRSQAGRTFAELYATPLDLRLTAPEQADMGGVDILFLALPHAAAAEVAAPAQAQGVRVIDLSADFRLKSAPLYETWYGRRHPAPELLDQAVYGLTEWQRDALPEARLVANPGCYPTSILLALGPLLRAGLLRGATVIADSKSGVTGAGRSPKVGSLFAEVTGNLTPYSIGFQHRHAVEIEQEMGALAPDGGPAGLIFSPHLLPVDRGLLSTIYVPFPAGWTSAQIRALYHESYAGAPFVWLLPEGEHATLAHVVRTNCCAISLHPVESRGQLVVVGAIDNLVKGAAGQAVQNMNLMFGLDERLGLEPAWHDGSRGGAA